MVRNVLGMQVRNKSETVWLRQVAITMTVKLQSKESFVPRMFFQVYWIWPRIKLTVFTAVKSCYVLCLWLKQCGKHANVWAVAQKCLQRIRAVSLSHSAHTPYQQVGLNLGEDRAGTAGALKYITSWLPVKLSRGKGWDRSCFQSCLSETDSLLVGFGVWLPWNIFF